MLRLLFIRIFRRFRARKAIGIAFVLILLAVSILGNALCYYVFDAKINPDITVGDALWYSVISITTIGYGDYSATSLGARLGTFLFVVLIGMTAFSVFFSMLIDWVSDVAVKRQRGLGTAMASNHILIVHFPNAGRVKQVIDELRSDPQHSAAEIVIISDQIEQMPFAAENVLFVHGSPLAEETYERAHVKDAKMAIVLARSYDDATSDALVASAVSVIDHLKPDVHIVAECVDDKHRNLFTSVRCDAIVSGLRIAGNLLVQEVHDPGITQMIEVITSNLRGATLFSTPVTEPTADSSYCDLAKTLLDRQVNVLCVNRGPETFTNFTALSPRQGDRVIYVADERISWLRLLELAKVR